MSDLQITSEDKGYTDKTFYDFDIRRERLFLANKKELNADAIIRTDTDTAMSIVSPSYQVVTHKEANHFAEELFEKNGLKYDEGHVSVSAGGARFFREFRFIDKAFTPATKGDISTALDGRGEIDSYLPTVILRNSCDKSSGFDFIFGGYRMVCSNGVRFGHDIAKIANRHIAKPDYDKIGDKLLDQLEANIEGFKKTYSVLNNAPAEPYLQLLVAQKLINNMTAKTMVEMSRGLISAEFEDEGKLSNISISENASAYLLYNIMTEIATHRSRKYNKALQLQTKLSKIFM